MPQKINVHGLFIDPERITDLTLQKRLAVFYPVFYETDPPKSFFGRVFSSDQHILRFDHHEPYGILLADAEQPSRTDYIMKYSEALFDKIFNDIGRTGKHIIGHISEFLKIETSGDREYRILQCNRNVKQISIREIPAKVWLRSGQWVNVFKSSPDYDFQGGSPYAVTGIETYAFVITVKETHYVLFGGGVDMSDKELLLAYHSLTEIYNEIQAKRDAALAERANKPRVQMPSIHIQLPKVELPRIDVSALVSQVPALFGKKGGSSASPALSEPASDSDPTDKNQM